MCMSSLPPPLVPHSVVHAAYEAIDAVWSPGYCGGRVIDDATQVFPATPLVVPPLVPHMVVLTFGETVQAVRCPRSDSRSRCDDPSQVFPATPIVTIPPLVPHGVVHPRTKQSIRSRPGHCSGCASITPPRSSQLLHPLSHHLCHMWLS